MGVDGRKNNCIYDSHYAETHKCKIGKVKGKYHDNFYQIISVKKTQGGGDKVINHEIRVAEEFEDRMEFFSFFPDIGYIAQV